MDIHYEALLILPYLDQVADLRDLAAVWALSAVRFPRPACEGQVHFAVAYASDVRRLSS
jgi:hypothetical protein